MTVSVGHKTLEHRTNKATAFSHGLPFLSDSMLNLMSFLGMTEMCVNSLGVDSRGSICIEVKSDALGPSAHLSGHLGMRQSQL